MKIGSLCSGYEGLGLAVQAVIGGDLAWVADNDPGAAAILAHHYPDVPNLGDITAVDWATVEPVDVLLGGTPCQDVSAAGARAGLRKGNRSGLWHVMAHAIGVLRPSLVIIENVRGLLTARGDEPTAEHMAAEAASHTALRLSRWLENEHRIAVTKGDISRARRCTTRTARVMGLRKRAVARCQWHERRLVRAIGTVLGSLADLGYDAQWTVVSAAEAGAPHRRERVFIAAWPAADADGHGREGNPELNGHPVPGISGRDSCGRHAYGHPGAPVTAIAQDPHCAASGERRLPGPGQAPAGRPRADTGGPGGARTAADADSSSSSTGMEPQARRHASVGTGAPVDRAGTDGGGRSGSASPDTEIGGWQRERAGSPGSRGGRPADGRASADATGDGRDEGRPEPAGVVGGPDAAECGHGTPADPHSTPGRRHGQGSGPGPVQGTAVAERAPEQPGRLHSGSGGEIPVAWGAYEPAVRRWESILGRPAPRPTEPGRTGDRLSPAFVEWMMGLPAGWVTDVPGLSRNAQLKALGNGVVPQQAAAALRLLLAAATPAADPAETTPGAAA